MKKIAICIPIKGYVSDLFLLNFSDQLIKNSREYDIFIVSSNKIPLESARNEILYNALKQNPDYLWWVDADIALPKNVNILKSLIEMNKDIASGLYFMRGEPYDPVFFILKDGKRCVPKPIPRNQIMEIDGVGLGCLLVKREIVEKMIKSNELIFEFEQKIVGDEVKGRSEDILFCEKAKEAGFKIYLNTGLVCGHIGTSIVDERWYK